MERKALIIKILNNILTIHGKNMEEDLIKTLKDFRFVEVSVVNDLDNIKYLMTIKGKLFAENMYTENILEWTKYNLKKEDYVFVLLNHMLREFGCILIYHKNNIDLCSVVSSDLKYVMGCTEEEYGLMMKEKIVMEVLNYALNRNNSKNISKLEKFKRVHHDIIQHKEVADFVYNIEVNKLENKYDIQTVAMQIKDIHNRVYSWDGVIKYISGILGEIGYVLIGRGALTKTDRYTSVFPHKQTYYTIVRIEQKDKLPYIQEEKTYIIKKQQNEQSIERLHKRVERARYIDSDSDSCLIM